MVNILNAARAVALAATLIVTPTTAQDTFPFQIDLLQPQNTTYLPTPNLPIVLAIHNTSSLSHTEKATNWSVAWYIMTWRGGHRPTGLIAAQGMFKPLLVDQPTNSTTGSNTTLFVGSMNLNTSELVARKQEGDTQMFDWYVVWNCSIPECGSTFKHKGCKGGEGGIDGEVFFSIEAPFEKEKASAGWHWVSGGKGIDGTDLTRWPECPVEVGAARTLGLVAGGDDTCPVVIKEEGARLSDCGLPLNEERKKAVSSLAASMASSSGAATMTTTTSRPTPTPTNAAPGLQGGAKLAVAAGVVGCIALAA